MWGSINGFKKSRKKIASEVENIVDKLMICICFHTTPKSDMTHYSFIFRNIYLFGKELNIRACSRLGSMLYLYIYNGDYYMKTYKFQHDIGGTADCMNLIMKANKGCGKLYSKDKLFDDGWLSGVKIKERGIQMYYIILGL